jgi:hypothetical protein
MPMSEWNPVDDEQDVAEELDEDLPAEYPPEEPLGLDDDPAPDDITEPEVWEREAAPAAETGPEIEGEPEPGTVDDEKDLVAPPLAGEDVGPLDPDDDFAGDETTRDVATERAPGPAEEAAVRVQDEVPGATE